MLQVRRNSPAYTSGINVGDEIVALNDFRVRPDQWEDRIAFHAPGDTVSVLVARRDELMRINLTIAPPKADEWQLQVRTGASTAQAEHLRSWLS